jgi:hypothetical protein
MKIPILSILATAAIVSTACSAPPVIRDTGPSPSASSSVPVAAPALAPQRVSIDDLPAWVDTIGARDAAAAGQPFVFPERDDGGKVAACRTYMRMPNGDTWIMNRPDTPPVSGVALSPRRDLLGCGDRGFGWDSWEARGAAYASSAGVPAPTVPRPDGVPDLSWISSGVDLTAAVAAMRAGLPFAFAVPSGGVAACHSAVLMPDAAVWVLNETGPVPIGGAALSRGQDMYGCNPGAPATGGTR